MYGINLYPRGVAFAYTRRTNGFQRWACFARVTSTSSSSKETETKREGGTKEQFRKSFPGNNRVRKGAGGIAFIRPKSQPMGIALRFLTDTPGPSFYGLLMFPRVILAIAWDSLSRILERILFIRRGFVGCLRIIAKHCHKQRWRTRTWLYRSSLTRWVFETKLCNSDCNKSRVTSLPWIALRLIPLNFRA